MARPPLPVGTYGRIRTWKVTPGVYRARARYRDYDGVTRPVKRTGHSPAVAENNLREALRDRRKVTSAGDVTADTMLADLAKVWLADVARSVRNGDLSTGTAEQYEYHVNRFIIEGIGRLRVSEASVSRLQKLIDTVTEKNGKGSARTTRSVLSGMLGLAVRHDALDRNPVRELGKIRGKSQSARSLELAEAKELRRKIHESEKAKHWDLVDFTDFMLATGLRIGEAAAVTWAVLDLDAGTVEVRGKVKRLKGTGLVIEPTTKSPSGYRTLELPRWAVEMLKRRRRWWKPNSLGVVFTAPLGGLRDPSNTQGDLRVIFDEAGYPWVTSHVYRKTVATLMDQAGLTARAAADQLGHAQVSMTQDTYFGRGKRSTGAATVLEAIEPEKKSAAKRTIKGPRGAGAKAHTPRSTRKKSAPSGT